MTSQDQDGTGITFGSSKLQLSLQTQTLLVYTAVLAASIAGIYAVILTLNLILGGLRNGSVGTVLGSIFGFCVAFALLFGNLMHLIASLGHLKLRRKQDRPDPEALQNLYEGDAPPAVFLIPSYKENLRLVRQTLLSAALQEYPNRRLVLLIDDPPYPSDSANLENLFATRRLPRELQTLLSRQALPLQKALESFLERKVAGTVDPTEEMRVRTKAADARALGRSRNPE